MFKMAAMAILGMFCIFGLLYCVQEEKVKNSILQERLSQQQYQLEVLVCRFNNKQPGETAELLEDGTVGYWRGR